MATIYDGGAGPWLCNDSAVSCNGVLAQVDPPIFTHLVTCNGVEPPNVHSLSHAGVSSVPAAGSRLIRPFSRSNRYRPFRSPE